MSHVLRGFFVFKQAGFQTAQERLRQQGLLIRIASRAGGPRMPDQGWTLRAQTHCQAKHRLMPCSGILEYNTGEKLKALSFKL